MLICWPAKDYHIVILMGYHYRLQQRRTRWLTTVYDNTTQMQKSHKTSRCYTIKSPQTAAGTQAKTFSQVGPWPKTEKAYWHWVMLLHCYGNKHRGQTAWAHFEFRSLNNSKWGEEVSMMSPKVLFYNSKPRLFFLIFNELVKMRINGWNVAAAWKCVRLSK